MLSGHDVLGRDGIAPVAGALLDAAAFAVTGLTRLRSPTGQTTDDIERNGEPIGDRRPVRSRRARTCVNGHLVLRVKATPSVTKCRQWKATGELAPQWLSVSGLLVPSAP